MAMILSPDTIEHLSLGTDANGAWVEVRRAARERVVLAFDKRLKRLVELHLVRGGDALPTSDRHSLVERATQAASLRGPTFLRILEVGQEGERVYYTTDLNDGEFVESYIQRVGPLNSVVAFALVLQLLEDLVRVQGMERVVAGINLDRVMVVSLEDAFLHLRVCDYGLSEREGRSGQGFGRLVSQCCQLLFLLLTGRVHGGENPDGFPVLTKLPTSLRTTLRNALVDSENAPTSLDALRDEVREAFAAHASTLQVRQPRKQLRLVQALQPTSQMQGLLLEGVPVAQLLGSRFRVEWEEAQLRQAFAIPVQHGKTGQLLTVHLLPPDRIVDKADYEAVPLQSWRFNADAHPNILRSLSLWEGTDWTFLTEERLPGFPLSRLLAERLLLNPAEVLVLLKQVRAGLQQAAECGVSGLDLHPSNLFLEVGKRGPNYQREMERMIQRRLDAWPRFLIKLRPHMTMASLCEAPLMPPLAGVSKEVQDRRSFVALAAFLLSGERFGLNGVEVPDTVPEPLAVYLRESWSRLDDPERLPDLDEFLAKFEESMSLGGEEVSLANRLRGEAVNKEELESVGSVSDFDGEWGDPDEVGDDYDSPVLGGGASRVYGNEGKAPAAKGRGALVLSAVLACSVMGLAWWLFAGGDDPAVAPVPETMAQAEATDHAPAAVADEAQGTAGEQASPPLPVQALVSPKKSPTASSETPTAPAKAPKTDDAMDDGARGPIIIKRAIVPTKEEVERLRKESRGPSAPKSEPAGREDPARGLARRQSP